MKIIKKSPNLDLPEVMHKKLKSLILFNGVDIFYE